MAESIGIIFEGDKNRGTYLRSMASIARTRRPLPTRSLFPLRLLLSVLSYLDHAFVVALHAVNALAGLGKDKFVDAILADLALEAVGVV